MKIHDFDVSANYDESVLNMYPNKYKDTAGFFVVPNKDWKNEWNPVALATDEESGKHELSVKNSWFSKYSNYVWAYADDEALVEKRKNLIASELNIDKDDIKLVLYNKNLCRKCWNDDVKAGYLVCLACSYT